MAAIHCYKEALAGGADTLDSEEGVTVMISLDGGESNVEVTVVGDGIQVR
jgi:hypothetical protein